MNTYPEFNAESEYTDVVLFSGGWESTLCAVRATDEEEADERRWAVLAFFDYGQRFIVSERWAARRLALELSLPLRVIALPASRFERAGPVVIDRNGIFFEEAARRFPCARTIWFGCRAPFALFDRFGDSNAQWARRKAADVGFHDVQMPALGRLKWSIRREVAERLPCANALVFSSEGLTP